MFQLLAHNHHCAEDYKVADEVLLKICLVKVLDYNARTIIIPLEQHLPFLVKPDPLTMSIQESLKYLYVSLTCR